MRGNSDRDNLFPLTTIPFEGYGSDPLERAGKVVIGHVDGKRFIQLNDSPEGYVFVADRIKATQFDDHSEASLKAAELIKTAVDARNASKEVVLVD